MRAASIRRRAGGVLAGALVALAVFATGAWGDLPPPKVTITEVSPAIVGVADASVDVTWKADLAGAYQVRAKANSCGTGMLVESGAYAGAPDTTLTTAVPTSLLTEGQNLVRVCVGGNTADSEPVRKDTRFPTSTANALGPTSGSAIDVSFTASDTGTGLQELELWVRGPGESAFSPVDSRAFTPPATTSQSGSFTYLAATEGVYEFYTRAKDAARNHEAAPSAADATTAVSTNDAPALTSSPSTVSVNEGSSATASGTFHDPDGDDVTLSASHGVIVQNGAASGTWGWTFATSDGPDDSRTITITADDGRRVTTRSVALVVRNTPPIASVRGPVSADEGETNSYTYTLTDRGLDTFTLVPGGLSCGTGGVLMEGSHVSEPAGGAFECSFLDGPARPAVRVTALDSDGATGTSSRMVSVANISPSATLSGGPADEGVPTPISFVNESDPSTIDADAGFRYVVRCDGTPFPIPPTYAESDAASEADCVFPDEGLFSVRGAIVDKDGGYREYTAEVAVANVPPTVEIAGVPASSSEGARIELTGSVTGLDADPHSLAWSVSKNGSPYGEGGGSSFAFTPDDDGSYLVVLTATDEAGGVGSDSETITVTNVGPAVTFTSGDPSIPEGSSSTEPHVYSFSISDPGTDHVAAVEADCGVGGTRVALSFGDSGGSITCTFSSSVLSDGPSTLLVRARATDDGGAIGPAASQSVAVTNVAPTVTPLLPAPFSTVRVFRAVNASATISDPGGDAPFSAWIEWGDGSVTNPAAISGNLFSGTHAYTSAGSYTIRFFGRDKDGGVGMATVPVFVSP
jgi:hypothetical protein